MSTVLVVEDETPTRDVIAEAVKELNYNVQTAATVAEAVRRVKARQPDAILLDMGLPDAAGTVGLDQLRNVVPTVPIIMLTANTDEALARETLRHGAFDYITKPFDFGRLSTVLQAAISG